MLHKAVRTWFLSWQMKWSPNWSESMEMWLGQHEINRFLQLWQGLGKNPNSHAWSMISGRS